MDKLIAVLEEIIEKYEIADEDVAKLQEVLYDVDSEDMYGDEYVEDEAETEEIEE